MVKVSPGAAVVRARISRVWAEPPEIDGKVCTYFTVYAEGDTYDTVGENYIWVDIQEVAGSRSQSPEPWEPGVLWKYSCLLHVGKDISGDFTLTIRAGHVENGKDVTDDTKQLVITPPPPEKVTVTGTVTGFLGLAIGGASVSFNRKLVYTDSSGKFKFSDVDTGSYTITVSHFLYGKYSKSVLISSDVDLKIDLSLKTEVVILAGLSVAAPIGLAIGWTARR